MINDFFFICRILWMFIDRFILNSASIGANQQV